MTGQPQAHPCAEARATQLAADWMATRNCHDLLALGLFLAAMCNVGYFVLFTLG